MVMDVEEETVIGGMIEEIDFRDLVVDLFLRGRSVELLMV